MNQILNEILFGLLRRHAPDRKRYLFLRIEDPSGAVTFSVVRVDAPSVHPIHMMESMIGWQNDDWDAQVALSRRVTVERRS